MSTLSTLKKCPACKGDGTLPDGKREVTCPWCYGSGELIGIPPLPCLLLSSIIPGMSSFLLLP
jgi:hypothetical protein